VSYLKYCGYGLLVIGLTSGCVRRVRHIPIEQAAPVTHKNKTTQSGTKAVHHGTLYDTTRTEHKYKLKPEPYSIGSKEKDPELLGPERTIEETTTQESATPVEVASAQPTVTAPAPTPAAPVLATTMSRGECISMIGADKFERYSKRFGGESGAIKRCTILKKLGRS